MYVQPSLIHDFEWLFFYSFESQGELPAGKCPKHLEMGDTVSNTAVLGVSMRRKMKTSIPKGSISGKGC